jgi:hypothetical protein
VLGDLVDARSGVAVAGLSTNRRVPATSGIALLATAVQDGRGDDALEVLRSADTPKVELVEVADDAVLAAEQLDSVRADVVVSGAALLDAAAGGDTVAALERWTGTGCSARTAADRAACSTGARWPPAGSPTSTRSSPAPTAGTPASRCS